MFLLLQIDKNLKLYFVNQKIANISNYLDKSAFYQKNVCLQKQIASKHFKLLRKYLTYIDLKLSYVYTKVYYVCLHSHYVCKHPALLSKHSPFLSKHSSYANKQLYLYANLRSMFAYFPENLCILKANFINLTI